MGIGIQQSQKPEVKGYVQGGINVAGMPKAPTQGDLGVKAGVQLEKKAFHAGAEAGIGIGLFQAKAEVGHKFDLNNKWDLDLAGKAEYKTQLGKPNLVYMKNTFALEGMEPQELEYKNSWGFNEIRLGAKAEAQYTTGKFKLGVGLEGGYRGNTLGDVHIQMRHEYADGKGNAMTYEESAYIDRGHKGGYVTPTLSAEYNIGKGLSIMAKGDIYQGEAGVRFTF